MMLRTLTGLKTWLKKFSAPKTYKYIFIYQSRCTNGDVVVSNTDVILTKPFETVEAYNKVIKLLTDCQNEGYNNTGVSTRVTGVVILNFIPLRD